MVKVLYLICIAVAIVCYLLVLYGLVVTFPTPPASS